VIGKLASCAAMAMTVAAYVAPTAWQRPVAIGVVALLTAVTCFGVTRTARLTQALVAVTLLGLVVVLAAAGRRRPRALLRRSPSAPAYGVLQAAGLLFFAFAGYARIATMGEEVRDPARTIPRAIGIALSAVLVVRAGRRGGRADPGRCRDDVGRTARRRGRRRRMARRRARDPGRGGRGRDRRAAGPAVGHRPHVARDGAERDLPSAWPRSTAVTTSRAAPSWQRARSWSLSSPSPTCAARSASPPSACCCTTSSRTSAPRPAPVRCPGVATTARRMARPGRGRHRLRRPRGGAPAALRPDRRRCGRGRRRLRGSGSPGIGAARYDDAVMPSTARKSFARCLVGVAELGRDVARSVSGSA
jgi:hypothetical protein